MRYMLLFLLVLTVKRLKQYSFNEMVGYCAQELSSLSVEPCVGESIVVTVFEISLADVRTPNH